MKINLGTLFLSCLILSTASAFAQEASGTLFFGTGPSNFPVYWRDSGRNEGYEVGADFLFRGRYCEAGFTFSGAGAAKFDNLDFVQFGPRAGCKIPHTRFTAEFVNWNGAPLGHSVPPDPLARRPDSDLNNTWMGVRYDFPRNRAGLKLIRWWHGIMGDLPIGSPRAFSRPYASQYIEAIFVRDLKYISVEYRPEFLLPDRWFTEASATNTLVLRRKIYGGFSIFAAGSMSTIIGMKTPGANIASFGAEMKLGAPPEKIAAEFLRGEASRVVALPEENQQITLTHEECLALQGVLEDSKIDAVLVSLRAKLQCNSDKSK